MSRNNFNYQCSSTPEIGCSLFLKEGNKAYLVKQSFVEEKIFGSPLDDNISINQIFIWNKQFLKIKLFKIFLHKIVSNIKQITVNIF